MTHKSKAFLVKVLFLLCVFVVGPSVAAQRTVVSFDRDWLFLKGDASGAEKPEFDDRNWRRLDVPHDWSIEGPVAEKNPTGPGGGFMPSGVSWYRKHFTISNDARNRLVF